MARIVAALIACDDVEAFGKQIDDLAFAFIAPLGADDCDDFGHSVTADEIPDVAVIRLCLRISFLC